MKKTLVLILAILLLALSFSYGCGPKKPETGKIKGTVMDSEGNPVAEATVTLEGGEGEENTDITLDDGNFLIEVSPGTYTLKIEKEGFETVKKDVEIKAGETVEISLTIKKKEEKPVFKSPTDLKSYHIIIYAGPKKEEAKKVFELWKDDNGDKIRVVALQDEENPTEVIKVGDDYAMKVGDAWSKNQPGLKGFFNNLLNNFEQNLKASKDTLRDFENYTTENDSLLPLEYKIEKLGNKMVNGYKSTGYRIIMILKKGNELKEPVFDTEIWAISTGKYKDYITKQDILLTTQDGSFYYRYDFFDIGRKQNIIMP